MKSPFLSILRRRTRVMYNITFQQIEAFLTVARYLNMTRAAEKLYVSQPTLSKTLQRFEKGIGFDVFSRSNQGMALTEQGEALYRSMEILYNNMESAIDRAASLNEGERKRLRLVLPSAFDEAEAFAGMRDTIDRYREKYPDVLVEESLCDNVEMRQKIEMGAADLVFAYEFTLENMKDACFRRICLCPAYLVMAADHPLAGYEKPPAELLAREVVYMLEGEGSHKDRLAATCDRLGFKPREIIPVSNFQTLLHVIRKRQGICMCCRLNERASESLKYYEVDNLSANAYCGIAWYPDKLSAQARNFLKLL